MALASARTVMEAQKEAQAVADMLELGGGVGDSNASAAGGVGGSAQRVCMLLQCLQRLAL